LHAADAGKWREFFQKAAEEIAAVLSFRNFVHRLKRHLLMKLLFVAGITDATHPGATDHRQEVEFIE
jgi:hypothetical protein